MMAVLEATTDIVKGHILAAVLGFVGLYIVTTSIRTYSRLHHIPGPPGTGWSIWWLAKHQAGGTLCCDLEEVADKYGPIARIGPDWVVVSDPTEIRRIWSVRSGYQRSPWYTGFRFNPESDNILTYNDNKEHHNIRSKLLPGYMGKGLGNHEDTVDEAILKFVNLINREYLTTNGQVEPKLMDGSRAFVYFSSDVNSNIEFSTSFGYLEKNRDINGIIEALETLMPATTALALFPAANWLSRTRLVKPFLPKPTDKEGVGRLLGVVQQRVQERYREKGSPETAKTRPRDVLQSFVETSLSPVEVEAEALVHLFGATDTTAAALRTTLFHLAAKPTAYRTLQAEIDSFFRSGKATRPVITDAEAKSLPYLQAVIKEGLRMWPPIMGLMPKSSSKDDIICGKKVPANTHVAWSPLSIMKNKELFGQDAQFFEPGRWIAAAEEVDATRLKEMEAVLGMAFAGGSRWECLGRKLALMEIGKVLFELVLRFDFAIANPMKPFSWSNHGLTRVDKLDFLVTKREVDSS
ncbi:cytochrome P450 family protein [Naviculisporaceae sp. PSN 640]